MHGQNKTYNLSKKCQSENALLSLYFGPSLSKTFLQELCPLQI